jgi:predicted RNA-binding Zn-ribbon protein involved in translation (DUF1610 family)
MTKTVVVKYQLGHERESEWTKTEYFCPNCGKLEVWSEDGPGDYYAGEDYVCTSCKCFFNLPSGTSIPGKEDYRCQIVDQLCAVEFK